MNVDIGEAFSWIFRLFPFLFECQNSVKVYRTSPTFCICFSICRRFQARERLADHHGRAGTMFGACKDGAFLAGAVSLPQLRFGIMHYVHLYNSRRIHLAFQYRTPDEVCFGTCNRNAMGYSKPRAFTPIFIITVVPFRGKVHFNCNCSVRWHRLAEIMGYLGWYIV